MISADAIRSYFERRLVALRNVERSGDDNGRESLLREDLRFIERVLSRKLGANHYELSVFVGGPEPDIMSYYDSAGHDYPRSRSERATTRTYYRDKHYAVVELLDGATEPMRIVSQTKVEGYNYTNAEQASAVNSTVLYRFLEDPPAALVVTCDKPDAFSPNDAEVATFVRAAGLAFQSELVCSQLFRTNRGKPEQMEAPGSNTELTWLHVSDLHFGAPTVGHRFDQKRVLDALLRDASSHGPLDYIFVTGDIGYSGNCEEYETAAAWVTALATVSHVPVQNVRFLPGNHDVQRDTVKRLPMLKTAHESIRNNPGRLDEYLVDPESRELLARKLAGYRTILSKHFPWHPGLADGAFDWEERLQTAKGIDVRLVGLSTVWVSDSFDGGAAPDTSLEANMLLGGAQLAATLGKMGKPEFLIILTHHPASWLTLSCRNLFVGEAARYPHVHLCGHVHEAEATLMRRLGDTTTNLTYVAGAAHGQPSDRHGYSWGALARDRRDGVWHVGWAPRIYVRDRNEFRPESTRFDLDDRHINWTELKISS